MTRRAYGRVLYDGLGNPVGVFPFIAAALPLIKGAAAALIPKAISAVAKMARPQPAPRPLAPAPPAAPAVPAAPVAPHPVADHPPAPQPVMHPVITPPSPHPLPPHPMTYVRPIFVPMPPYGARGPGMYPMLLPSRRRLVRRVVVRRA